MVQLLVAVEQLDMDVVFAGARRFDRVHHDQGAVDVVDRFVNHRMVLEVRDRDRQPERAPVRGSSKCGGDIAELESQREWPTRVCAWLGHRCAKGERAM